MSLFIAVDCGGTKLAFAAYANVTDQKPIRPGFSTPTTGEYITDLGWLIAGIKRAAREVDYSYVWEKSITGIGITAPGRLDAARSKLEAAGNVTGWVGQELFRDLQSAFPSSKVTLGNDGEGQALAEAIRNPDLEDQGFLLVAPGTGIAFAAVHMVDGKVTSIATEGAHQIIDPTGSTPRDCGCGHNNCLESYAGGDGIAKRYGKPAADLTRDEWNEVAGWLAVGTANALTFHMLPTVVLGGGIAAKQPHLLSSLAELLGTRQMNVPSPRVIRSGFGDNAGTLGGLAMLTLAG